MRHPLWTDHRPRIDFYVKAGLVRKAPSDAQLDRAFERIGRGFGLGGQVRYYAKHPLMILPTARKRAATRLSIDAIATRGFESPESVAVGSVQPVDRQIPVLDRFLETLFLFVPARFAAQTLFNPWAVIPTTGLNTGTHYLIAHILHTNHPPPAIWDMQIVHADEHGLDELERRIEQAMRGRQLRMRVERALGCREGYYEHLLAWIPRVRRFEYPPIPRGLDPIKENLIEYLRYAAEC